MLQTTDNLKIRCNPTTHTLALCSQSLFSLPYWVWWWVKLAMEAIIGTGYAKLKFHHFLTPLTGSKPTPQLGCANWVRPSLKINIPHLQCVKLGSTRFESVPVKGVIVAGGVHSILLKTRNYGYLCTRLDVSMTFHLQCDKIDIITSCR